MLKQEVILPRRALKQPSPNIYPGGDCGACCIAGALNISIEAAYEIQDKDGRPIKDKPVCFSRDNLAWTLRYGDRSLVDTVIDEIPIWPYEVHEVHMGYGHVGWLQNMAWWNYIRMGLLGGFYAIAQIDFNYRGPLFDHDHWVMIVGAREVEIPIVNPVLPPGCSRIEQQILISCSASNPQGYWKEAREFLKQAGGFNVVLVRPR